MKPFKDWNRVKIETNFRSKTAFFTEKDIFYARIGTNIGFEEDGKGEKYMRPVLILRKFNNNVAIIIPLSTTKKTGKFYFKFSFTEKIISNALLSQLKLIDSKRLENKIGEISSSDFILLKKELKNLLKL